MKRALLLLPLLAACSSKKSEPGPAPTKLTIIIDGKPVAIDRAFIKRTSLDVHTVTLGGSCTEPGTLGLTLTKRLAASGHERYLVTDIYARDFDPQLSAPVAADLTERKVTLELATPKLAIDASFEVTECPDLQPTGVGVPKMTHKSTGSITVANKRLEIKGVTVKARTGVEPTDLPDIVISTAVKDCSPVLLPAPIILARTDGTWTMRGTYFEGEHTATETTLAFNANTVGKSPDGPTLELQLTGSGKLGDYTVKLEGTAEAIECLR